MEDDIRKYFKYVDHRLKNKSYALEYRLATFISRRLFASVECIGLDSLAKQRRAELARGTKTVNIYIARHLSEFDWQEIQRLCASVNMMAAVQAGDNLFIGPLDPLLRHHGAFKVFRDQACLYSDNWLANSIYRYLDPLWEDPFFKKVFSLARMKRRKPVIIDPMMAKDIYTSYMKYLIDVEGRDILIFPEYLKLPDKKVKYGRSYSGKLLEFTPLIFKLLRDINKKTERRIQIVPVNASYERVVEDQSFKTLEKMKSNRYTRRFVYLTDYFFNYTHWLYQPARGRVVVKFGEPVPLKKTMDFKFRLHDEIRKKVGQLQTVFPTQVVGYALGDNGDLRHTELLRRIEKTVHELKKTPADLRYVEKLSAEEIIKSTYEHFNVHPKRRFLVKNESSRTHHVLRQDVLSQYRNHILHLFEKWYEADQLMKIIDIFRDESDATGF